MSRRRWIWRRYIQWHGIQLWEWARYGRPYSAG